MESNIASKTSVVEFLDRPEGRIAYDIEGQGPLVVCLPGMGDLRSSYRFLSPALVEAGCRVACMDLRGHGDSDATFSTYDDVAAGTDALALVEHLGGPAVLVGNSMGSGACAWATAESFVAGSFAEERSVSGLVLISPFVRNPPVSRWAMLAFRLALMRPWGRAAWRRYYASLYPGRPPSDMAEQQALIDANLRAPGHWQAFAATTHTSHEPVEKRLDEIQAPTLVIVGEHDSDYPDPAAEARLVADRLGGEVMVIPGAGHYPHVEYPELVCPAVAAFVKKVMSLT